MWSEWSSTRAFLLIPQEKDPELKSETMDPRAITRSAFSTRFWTAGKELDPTERREENKLAGSSTREQKSEEGRRERTVASSVLGVSLVHGSLSHGGLEEGHSSLLNKLESPSLHSEEEREKKERGQRTKLRKGGGRDASTYPNRPAQASTSTMGSSAFS